MINSKKCTDPSLIAKEISAFYQNLYSSSYSVEDSDFLWDKFKEFIPHIDNDFREECDKDFTMDELDKAYA